MPHSPAASKLRLIGMAVEEALNNEKFEELFALLSERQILIDNMIQDGLTLDPAEIADIQAQNDHLSRRMRAAQSDLANTARVGALTVKAVRAYKS